MRGTFGAVGRGEPKELKGGQKGPGGGWPCARGAGGSCRTPIWPGTSEAAGCGTPEVGQAADGGRLAMDWIGLGFKFTSELNTTERSQERIERNMRENF